jgi:uncharacterized protein YecT (DUF1311 family)
MLARLKFHLILMLLLASASPLTAQLSMASDVSMASDATQNKCEEYSKTLLPNEAASASSPTSWPDCNSYKLYYGIGAKVDFTAARKCAWSERIAQQKNMEPRYTTASVFGGSAMLTVLYANGQGVKQDYPLALRFACEAGGAPAEINIRLEHLESLSTKPTPIPNFDFCNDITSGFMEGFCAALGSESADKQRTSNLNALKAKITEEQRRAFDLLIEAQENYAHAHAAGEIDLSGTARAMYQIDAEQTLRDDFLTALQAYEKGSKPPSASASDYHDADARLNYQYRESIADAEKQKAEYGAVQPEGIRNAERAWLKYRDAWLAFVKLHYPQVAAEAWLTLLTKDRTSILDGSFCDMDAVDGKCKWTGDTWKPSPLP